MKVGLGIDFHSLKAGKKLILAGVEIEHRKGLVGFSDADVLTHSICEALLGSSGLGDLGTHFPDTDEQYRNISSLRLLKRVQEMVNKIDHRVNNIDATIIAETPKLSPYIKEMKKNISEVLNISSLKVNIKATTSEGLGPWGREEGIAAYSIATIEKI